ncbi:hypothetical protein M8J76_011610 [Diaphorina citri]|nr:hypothetical protein M8J76_011610 [Diaphorina citri]
MPKNKKLSDSEASASSDEEVKKKRGPAKKPQPAASKKGGASKDGESSGGPAGSWCLEGMRFVKVDEFRGRPLISIREYYEKNGQLLPGKKGISLSATQWRKLLTLQDSVNSELDKY